MVNATAFQQQKVITMKKFIAVIPVLLVALSLTACGDNKAEKEKQEREHAAKISKAVKMPM